MDKLVKLANWLGRKFIALFMCLVILLFGGIFSPEKLSTIGVTIGILYGAFVTGHAATDVLNNKKTDVTVKTKVEEKTEQAD